MLSQAAPQSEELQHITTDLDPETHKLPERHGRAMYFTKNQLISTTMRSIPAASTNVSKQDTNNTLNVQATIETPSQDITSITNNSEANVTNLIHPAIQRAPMNETESKNMTNQILPQNQTQPTTDSPTTAKGSSSNYNSTVPLTKKRNNLTRHPDVKDLNTSLEGASESRIVTEKPLSLETTYLQTRIPANIESSRRVIDQSSQEGGMDMGAIAGISFAALVLTALAGSTAFVLYRRRYLNKPQTLNDKCSNPDSSGYLDDSTIRVS